MSSERLNIDPTVFASFDAAPAADDLSAFDAATGVTVIPPGWYVCRLEVGELVTTKKNKPAYRLRFAVCEPAEHAGFALWRYYLPTEDANRAKQALSQLGLRTSADLRRAPFPEVGRTIICNVLVTMQKKEKPEDPDRNDVERFTVVSDETAAAPSSANRFTLPADTGEGSVP